MVTVSFKVNQSSLNKTINKIVKRQILTAQRTAILMEKIRDLGIYYAEMNTLTIWDTGALHDSMDGEVRIAYPLYRTAIFTPQYYAKFVEYGWGLGGAAQPHPKGHPSYVYDYNGKGLKGFRSRAFFFYTLQDIERSIPNAAREAFRK
jgi:hypothetical protein